MRYAARMAVTTFIKKVTTTAAPGANAPLTASGPIRALRGTVSFFNGKATSIMMVP
jgi:hypothetical protein